MSQGGASSSSGSGSGPVIETITGNSGGAVAPDATFNFNLIANTTLGITTIGTPASNQINILGIQSDTTQIGVAEMATAAETGALTDSTRTVSPSSLEPILISPYVVASGGAYTTIQSALDAANAAGGGTVYVRGGTWTEDLTLYDGVDIIGYSESATIIAGMHTPPTTGTVNIFRCTFTDATAIFSSAAAGSSTILIEDSTLSVTNGFSFDLANWTGTIALFDMGVGGTQDGFINNTGGATVFAIAASLGVGTSNTMITSGSVFFQEIDLGCPWNAQTGSDIQCDYTIFSAGLTLSNDSTGIFDFCRWTTGATASITMSSSASISIADSIINSSANPCIAGSGAGTLTLNNISFLNNAAIAGTLTLGSSSLYPVSMTNGQLLIGSTGQPATAATLTAGSGVSIMNSAGSITISSSGSFVLIQSQDASLSTSIDFTTNVNSYNNLFLVYYNVASELNIANLEMLISTDGGSSYITTNYQSGFTGAAYNSAALTNSNGTSSFLMCGNFTNTATDTGAGYMYIFDVLSGAYIKVRGNSDFVNGGTSYYMTNQGHNTNSGVDALRFQFTGGSKILTGTFSLYGIVD